jgi:hypothetical protein
LSSHRSGRFEREYGVLVKEWRLFQRVVFVVDKDDRFVHVVYVPDQMTAPDYDVRNSLRNCAGVAMWLLPAVGLLSFVGGRHCFVYARAYRVMELFPVEVGMDLHYLVHERLDGQLCIGFPGRKVF